MTRRSPLSHLPRTRRATKPRYPRPSASEALVLAEIVRRGGATQPTIAGATGLSQQTVSRLTGELFERGVLRAGARLSSGRRGQPSVLLEIEPGYAYSVGLALMSDAMSVLLMDFAGRVVAHEHIDMQAMTRAAVLSRLAEQIDRFAALDGVGRQRIFGLGVGVAGYCLDGKSRYNTVHALDDWAMVEIDRTFGDALGLPTWVENDGNAAAIGESLLGVGRTHPSFAYLFIAAGVGGGVVIDHELVRGAHGNAGEMALILPKNIYLHPSLETLRQTLLRRGVIVDGISDLVRRFDPLWPGVDEWLERTRDSFSMIVSAVAALLDPDAVVLGGRIPRALAQLVVPHIEIYDNTRRAEPRPFPRILLSETTQDACAIGAASMPFKRHFFTPVD